MSELLETSKEVSKIGTPLVSVVIPSYNHGIYIQECIRSVIAQGYDNIELIIIDDGSSDSSVAIIGELISLCEKRFVRFKFISRENKGLSTTLNEAIEWCEGVYFSAIASDDVMLPQKTSTLVNCIDNNDGLAGVFSGCFYIDSSKREPGGWCPVAGIYSFEDIFLRRESMVAPSQLLRLERVKSVGGYKEDVFIEDFYMWLCLTKNGDCLEVLDEVLVGYRQHDDNTASQKNALRMYEERVKILRYFSGHLLFKKAMAVNCLAASFFLSSANKCKSIEIMVEGIRFNWRIIFSRRFVQSCIRFLVPRSLFLYAMRIRDERLGF